MLAQVERAYRTRQPVVFLAWAPHPMNTHFNVRYLTGGDAIFGPNFGAATVRTLVRKGYQQECPNVARLLQNLEFSVELENEWMDRILSDKVRTADLAVEWLAKRPPVVQTWLAGVTGFDGRPAQQAFDEPRQVIHLSAFEDWITANKIPVGDAATTFVEYTKKHAHGLFDGIAAVLTGSTNVVARILNGVPAPVLIVLIAALSWVLRRSIGLVVFVVLSLLFIMNQGYWDATLETLTLVLVAAIVATVIGVPLGIWGAKRPRVYAGDAARARPDADAADVRLPDADAGAVRARHRAGPDLDDHLRVARADPPDAARHFVGAQDAARSRAGVRRHAAAAAVQGGTAERRAR